MKKLLICMLACQLPTMTFANPSSLYSELDKAMQSWQDQGVNKQDSEFEAFKRQRQQEFATYVEQHLAEYDAFRDELIASWGEAQSSGKSQFVAYSKNDSARLNVDFSEEQLTLSIKHDPNVEPNEQEVQAAFQSFLKKHQAVMGEFFNQTPIQNQANNLKVEKTQRVDKAQRVVAIKQAAKDIKSQTQSQIQALEQRYDDVLTDNESQRSKQAEFIKQKKALEELEVRRLKKLKSNVAKIVTKPKKETAVTEYSIKLPKGSVTSERAKQYLKQVVNQGERFKLSASTILAVMHTESHFNPMAKSHIPAYGLMQVVPTSAGVDVNRFLFNIDAPMSAPYLYVTDNNIEAGAAYLHLLNERYLRHIQDPLSRKYCMIAAYNTGAGNVARVFNSNDSRNIKAASKVINSLSPDKVLEALKAGLPYDETRRYIRKVLANEQKYQAI